MYTNVKFSKITKLNSFVISYKYFLIGFIMKKLVLLTLAIIVNNVFAGVFSGEYFSDFRIKNPSACPQKVKLSYFSDKKLNLFIPEKELSTHTEGDFINFEDRDNQQALISIDNLYGPVAKLKILKKNGKIKETHTLRSLGDGLVWQQTKNKKTQTCIYLDYQTPESDSF